jgi:tetratricopeptide (TPR) repeat protein
MKKNPLISQGCRFVILMIVTSGVVGLCLIRHFEFNPTFAQIFLIRGREFAHNEQWDKAQAYYRKAMQLNPFNEEPYNGLGEVYRSRGMVNQARDYFERALAINPNYGNALHNVGLTYFDEGDMDQAMEVFEHALRSTHSRYESAYYSFNLARVYLAIRDIGGARLMLDDIAFADHDDLAQKLKEMIDSY